MTKQTLFFILIQFMAVLTATAQNSNMTKITVRSTSIESNLVEDGPEVNVGVFLPPGYHKDLNKRYPVMYWLHGFSGWKNTSGKTGWGENRVNAIVKMMKAGEVKPMIIVMPDAANSFGGSFYTNSLATGNWEDLIAYELPNYIDANYRTISKPESRGIGGHSMGGSGAVRIAIKHADIFSAVYGGGSCCLSDLDFLFNDRIIRETLSIDSWETRMKGSFYAKGMLAVSAAYSPDPDNPPFYADLPYELSGDSLLNKESVKAKWAANTVLWMADQYISNLKRLKGIYLGVGTRDPYISGSIAFSAALKKYKIEHSLDVFEGGHGDKLNERIVNNVLPFFSEILMSE